MDGKTVHDMTTSELTQKLGELKVELFNLRFSHATGQLANPMTLANVKRDIARVKTVLRERELGIEKKAVEKKGAKAK